MEVNDKSYWDVNRNRDRKDWIPTDINELEVEIKRLQDIGTDPNRLQLCKNVYERLSEKIKNKS